MSVKEGDRSEMIPALQAALRRLGVDAVKGSAKAQQMVLKLAAETQRPAPAEKLEVFRYWSQYDVERIPTIAAIFRSLLAIGLKGNGPAQRAALQMVKAIESENRALYNEYLK